MLHFNLEQISAFVAVAASGSFSAAARSCGKSRSTLHHQITNLEIDLNLSLFIRVGKGLTLTKEGKILLRQAKHLLYHAQYLQNSADTLSSGEGNLITVYHDAILPPQMIARADRWVTDAFPLVNIQWLHRSRDEMYQALRSGDADLGLALSGGGTLPLDGVDFFNLGGIPLDVYTSLSSPLVSLQPCSLHDLSQHQQLILEDYLNTALSMRTQVTSNPKKVSNVDVLTAILEKEGWAVLPVALMNTHPKRDQFATLELDFFASSDSNFAEYVIYSNKLNTAGPALSLLIDSIKTIFADELSQ